MTTRRTVRTVKWVIETQDLSEQEHEKRVGWAEQNLSSGVQRIKGAFVYAVVFDDDGNPIRFSGNGLAVSAETRDMLLDLIGDSTDQRDAS